MTIAYICPRYVVQPDWVRIVVFFDQNPAVYIRDRGESLSISTIFEPSGILCRELYINSFQTAFLWIICYQPHKITL